MRFVRGCGLGVGLGLLVAGIAGAQEKSSPGPGGTVSGHVFLGDTDGPARFAKVLLKPVTAAENGDDFFAVLLDGAIVNMQTKAAHGQALSGEEEAALKAARATSKQFLTDVGEGLMSVTVGVDGGYRFTHVRPGSYYLHVKEPGYVDTLAAFTGEDLSSSEPAVRKRVTGAVQTVSIAGDEPVRADVRLERGAVLAGRVNYDDGTAAVGWTVRAMARRNASAAPTLEILGMDLSALDTSHAEEVCVTDDGGRFRIAGLPTGEYVLQARMTAAAMDETPFGAAPSTAGSLLSIAGGVGGIKGLRMTVYSGDVTRVSEAKSIAVRAGEERAGANLTVSLRGARTVSGYVVAGLDGHPVNGGSVVLAAGNDAQERWTAGIREDGSFRFDLVPAGSYTLRTSHAGDSVTSSSMKILGREVAERKLLRGYGAGAVAVEVGDGDVVLKLVVPEKE